MIFSFNAGEVFKIALTIETNGYNFYEKVASKPFDPEVVSLFKWLAQEEMNHKSIFSQLMQELPEDTVSATVWDPDNELDIYLKQMADQHVFNQAPEAIEKIVNTIQSPADAIKIAMGFEKDTIIFFLELQAASEKYDESQAKIKLLVDEERKHLAHLTKSLQKLSAA